MKIQNSKFASFALNARNLQKITGGTIIVVASSTIIITDPLRKKDKN